MVDYVSFSDSSRSYEGYTDRKQNPEFQPMTWSLFFVSSK